MATSLTKAEQEELAQLRQEFAPEPLTPVEQTELESLRLEVGGENNLPDFGFEMPTQLPSIFNQPEQPEPQEERPLWQSVAAVSGGAQRGISDIIGVPVDIIAAGMRGAGLPVPEQPVGGTEFFKKHLQPIQPEGAAERVLSEASRFLGGSVAGTGVVTRLAQKAKGFRPLRTAADTTTERIVKDIAEADAMKFAKAEVLPSIGAGVAVGTTQEVTDSPMAQFLAGLAGGFAPPALTFSARFLGRKVKDIKNAIKPSAAAKKEMSKEAELVAGAQLREATGGTSGIKAESELELLRKYGGGEPTIAQATTTDVGVELLRERIKQSPEAARRLQKVTATQQESINRQFEKLAPDGDPNSVRVAVARNIDKAEKSMETASNIGANISLADAGGGTRFALIRLENEAADSWRTLYAQGDSALGGSPKINTNNIKTAAKSALDKFNVVVGKTATVADVPDAISLVKKWKKTEDLSTLLGIERKVNAELRASQSGLNPNAVKEGVLIDFKNSLRGLIDDATDSLIATAKTGKQRSAAEIYSEARQLRATHARIYGRGVVADILKKNVRGDFTQTESSVVKKILENEENAAGFKAAAGDDPAGELLIEYGVAQELKTPPLSNEHGEVIAKNLEKWLAKKQPALRHFPNVEKRVRNIAEAQKMLDEANLTRSVLDGDPETAIRDIFASSTKNVAKKRLDNLLNAVEGDIEATRGLAKAFWKEANARAKTGEVTINGEPILQTGKISNFIKDDKFSWFFERLYTPQQRKDWDGFLRTAKILNDKIAKTGTIALEEKELKRNALFTIETLASKFWAIARGVVGVPYTATTIGAQALSKISSRFQRAEVRALMNEAVFNPELAQDLMLAHRNPELTVKKLRMWLGMLGMGSIEADQEDLPQPQVERRQIQQDVGQP